MQKLYANRAVKKVEFTMAVHARPQRCNKTHWMVGRVTPCAPLLTFLAARAERRALPPQSFPTFNHAEATTHAPFQASDTSPA